MICQKCADAADGIRHMIKKCPWCGRTIAQAEPGSEKRATHKATGTQRHRPRCDGSGKPMFIKLGHPVNCGCSCQHAPAGTVLLAKDAHE